jgi:hypothetical protein
MRFVFGHREASAEVFFWGDERGAPSEVASRNSHVALHPRAQRESRPDAIRLVRRLLTGTGTEVMGLAEAGLRRAAAWRRSGRGARGA